MEQFFEHSDLGLGALTFQKGPGTIHCWTGRIADTEILFSIILNTSELRSANLDFIRSVLQNWREYLSKAEHEIHFLFLSSVNVILIAIVSVSRAK